MLLCIYRGAPEPQYPQLGSTMSEIFGGTEGRDLDMLLSQGLIGPARAGGWLCTSAGRAHVEHQLLGQPVAAEEWLRTAKLGVVGFHGEHEEGGAAFRLGGAAGIRISGPALHEFGQLSKEGISPYRVYSAFTTELIARWNNGPVNRVPIPSTYEEGDTEVGL